jgi:hypothetical protein
MFYNKDKREPDRFGTTELFKPSCLNFENNEMSLRSKNLSVHQGKILSQYVIN